MKNKAMSKDFRRLSCHLQWLPLLCMVWCGLMVVPLHGIPADEDNCHAINLTNRNTSAVLTTPGYPHSYPHSVSLCWIINVTEVQVLADEHYVVKVEITDTDLKGGGPGEPCHAYGEVRDGKHSYSTRLGFWCNVKPRPYYSTQGVVRIGLRSDASGVGRGFMARVSPVALAGTGSASESSHLPCRSLSIGSPEVTYVLTSPGYPGLYMNYRDYCYVISLSPNITNVKNYTIRLRVDDASLEPSEICRYDYITIQDGRSPDGYVMRKFCGNNKPTDDIVSCKRGLYIHFHTDSTNIYHGFRMRYAAVPIEEQRCTKPKRMPSYIVAGIIIAILFGFLLIFAAFFTCAAVNKKNMRVHGHNQHASSDLELCSVARPVPASNVYEIPGSGDLRSGNSNVKTNAYMWARGAGQDDTGSLPSSSDGEELPVYEGTV